MTEQYAKALVDCGYAEKIDKNGYGQDLIISDRFQAGYGLVDPFSDTLEGRRQADALEDWLDDEYDWLWSKSQDHVTGYEVIDNECKNLTLHQWRLDRIKWCFEQLEAVE